MRPNQSQCLQEGPQSRRSVLKTTLRGLLLLDMIEATDTAFAQNVAIAAPSPLIEVYAYGHTLGDVVERVSPLTPWRLSVSREVTNERVAIAFRGSAEEFRKGLASLFGFSWVDVGDTKTPNALQLQMVRGARALEAQLRMEPFTRMSVGLKRKADKTLATVQEAPNTYYEIGTAWGERFLSLLTPHELAGALEQGFLTATVGELPTPAQEALFHFVEGCIKARAADDIPEYKAMLNTLTPDKVRASTIVFRARSAPWGGYVQAKVVRVDSIKTVLGIEEARFPQRVNPYDFAAKKGRAVAKPDGPKQIASSPGGSAPASKAPIEVEVPEEWGEMIKVVHRITGKNVFSDYYTRDPEQEAPKQTVKRYKSADAPDFLDALCKSRQAVWWDQTGCICIRHQFWFMLNQCEPPLALRRQVEDEVRAGKLRIQTLYAMANLTRPRLLTLLQQTAVGPNDEFDLDETAFADFLELFKAGTSDDISAIFAQGLPLNQFSPALLAALRRLAPDSPIFAAAEKSPANFYLKVEQTPVKANARPVLLRFRVTGPAAAAGERFQVPVKDVSRPLVVLGVKG